MDDFLAVVLLVLIILIVGFIIYTDYQTAKVIAYCKSLGYDYGEVTYPESYCLTRTLLVNAKGE